MALSGRTDIRHTFPAAGDLTDALYHFVTLDASDELALAGAGDRAFILFEDVDHQGASGTVVLHGKAKVVLGEDVDALDDLTSDGDGAAVVAGAGDAVNAFALEAGVAGQVIQVFTVYSSLSDA